MRAPAKVFVVSLVTSVTFALGVTPALASPLADETLPAAAVQPGLSGQQIDTISSQSAEAQIVPILHIDNAESIPHNFDVQAAIQLAEDEIGTSRPTGWSQPGECIMSAQRWVRAGGGNWTGGGNPVTNYDNATRVTLETAAPGDIIQYEYTSSPTSWVTGIHTVMVTGINDDGTFTIIESNNPTGSGIVTKKEHWVPNPPAGFEAVVWRF